MSAKEHPVAKKHPAVVAMEGDWSVIDALRGGTPAMRAEKTRFLPKRKYEDPEVYAARVSAATLLPAFVDAVKEMVGRAFAKPMQVSDKIPQWITDEFLGDVDMEGRNLETYAREWLDIALAYGISHSLIESPEFVEGAVTLEDEKRLKLRPYLIHIKHNGVLGWRVSGGELVQLRVMLALPAAIDEYNDTTVPTIRVYQRTQGNDGKYAVTIQDWQQNEKEEWMPVGALRKLGVSEIPLVTAYTGRLALMVAQPPLRELAYLNCKHFRLESSVDNIVDVASVPILAIIGDTGGSAEGDETEVKVGANTALTVPLGGDIKYVEHTGKGIECGFSRLETIKEDMRNIGAKMLVRVATGPRTATEAGEDSTRENSPLSAIISNFQSTLITLLGKVAAWRAGAPDKLPDDTVKLNPNLQPFDNPTQTMTVLNAMADSGRLSDETVFDAAKVRGMIPEEHTWDDEVVRIQNSLTKPEPEQPPAPQDDAEPPAPAAE